MASRLLDIDLKPTFHTSTSHTTALAGSHSHMSSSALAKDADEVPSPTSGLDSPAAAAHSRPLLSPYTAAFPSGIPPGTPKSLVSLRLSDEDDNDDQDPASAPHARHSESHHEILYLKPRPVPFSESQPTNLGNDDYQLRMPSIPLPDRRPFTTNGRHISRLRICIAGRKSAGKSSLVGAIAHQCEDIVHIDTRPTLWQSSELRSVSSSPSTSPLRMSSSTSSSSSSSSPSRPGALCRPVSTIPYILASTKSYPPWYSDLEESRVLRRRTSFNLDQVLERNLCFVDFPSHEPLQAYIQELFWRLDDGEDLTTAEKLHLVSGQGSYIVDVVLFIFTVDANYQILPEDVTACIKLSELTNVVPLIGKTDLLSDTTIRRLKADILRSLTSAQKLFLFGQSISDSLEFLTADGDVEQPASEVQSYPESSETSESLYRQYPILPFAISSKCGSDDSEMDASLLMSSRYSPPLCESELSHLTQALFNPEHIKWLRHCAARKYFAWRDRQLSLASVQLSDPKTIATLTAIQHTRLQRLARESARKLAASKIDGERKSNNNNNKSGKLISRPSYHANRPSYGLLGHSFSSQLQVDINPNIVRGIGKREKTRWLPHRTNDEAIVGDEGGSSPQAVRRASMASSITMVKRERNRRTKSSSELPAWSEQRETAIRKMRSSGKSSLPTAAANHRQIDARDPLGLTMAWETWGKSIVLGAGGGLVVGVIWVVMSRSFANWP